MTSTTRVPPVMPGTHTELAPIEATIIAERGRISLLYSILLNSPPFASGWEKLLSAVRNHGTVAPALRELIILRVAVLNGASYEFIEHQPIAMAAGISALQIEAVSKRSTDRSMFSEDEQMALELTDAMTIAIAVPDDLMVRLSKRFDDRSVVEMVVTVAAYNMVSRFLVAMNITH